MLHSLSPFTRTHAILESRIGATTILESVLKSGSCTSRASRFRGFVGSARLQAFCAPQTAIIVDAMGPCDFKEVKGFLGTFCKQLKCLIVLGESRRFYSNPSRLFQPPSGRPRCELGEDAPTVSRRHMMSMRPTQQLKFGFHLLCLSIMISMCSAQATRVQ